MKSSWRTYACTVSSTPVSNVYHGRRGLPLLLPLLLHGWASTFPFVETAHPCLMKASVLRRTCGQPCSSRITVGVRHGHNIERLVRLAMSWKKTPSGQAVPCTAIVTCLCCLAGRTVWCSIKVAGSPPSPTTCLFSPAARRAYREPSGWTPSGSSQAERLLYIVEPRGGACMGTKRPLCLTHGDAVVERPERYPMQRGAQPRSLDRGPRCRRSRDYRRACPWDGWMSI